MNPNYWPESCPHPDPYAAGLRLGEELRLAGQPRPQLLDGGRLSTLLEMGSGR